MLSRGKHAGESRLAREEDEDQVAATTAEDEDDDDPMITDRAGGIAAKYRFGVNKDLEAEEKRRLIAEAT